MCVQYREKLLGSIFAFVDTSVRDLFGIYVHLRPRSQSRSDEIHLELRSLQVHPSSSKRDRLRTSLLRTHRDDAIFAEAICNCVHLPQDKFLQHLLGYILGIADYHDSDGEHLSEKLSFVARA